MNQAIVAKLDQHKREAHGLMCAGLGMTFVVCSPVLGQGHTLAAVSLIAFSGLLAVAGLLLKEVKSS